MTSIRLLATFLLAATAMLWAQNQNQSSGGWRRVGDPAPAPAEGAAPPQQAAGQDPTQPVERPPADGWGNVQQQPNDRPPAARRDTPPPYGLPPELTIKPGTFVTVRTSQMLSSDHNQQGDLFTATLDQPIVVDGVVVAQHGQMVTGRVAEAKKAGRVEGTSRLALQLTGITLADGTQANVQTSLATHSGPTSVGNDVAAVGATTAMGAAIGAAADWGRGAAIGAGAGAAAGLIGVLLTRGHPTVVYPESVLTFRLDTPVTVNTTHAAYAYRYVGPEDYSQPVQARMQPRPVPRPAPAPYYGGYPYPYPYPYPYYGAYYGYPGYWGPGFGVGVVIGGPGWHRWH
ncbi:MAG TPA: hypothetical protein VMH28_28555 [Candidatus Acidoferrales bacterium]|nr:hypothetical protein [Candidatus Acidoferrales bacterium]